MDAGALKIGQRLQVDKYPATVRYLGQVDGQQGVWVGLQWDDIERGKHDGSLNGRRYFSCSDGQQSASFVRKQKLLDVATFGITVKEALIRRFVSLLLFEDHHLNSQDVILAAC